MQLNCLIIDDKPLAIDILVKYVEKTPFLRLAGTSTNPVEGLHIIRNQAIDLIFLDIQMPELNGLQFIRIAGKASKFILTTAYSEYALDGYEHDVIDYLLKPVAFDRFYRAAEKAFKTFTPGDNSIRIAQPAGDLLKQPSTASYLFVKTEHRIQKVNLSEIQYIESLQNYISIQTASERIMSLQTLKRTEEQLPPADFVRVHKSYIVALKHISYIERNRIYVANAYIPIGDSYRGTFYNLLDK